MQNDLNIRPVQKGAGNPPGALISAAAGYDFLIWLLTLGRERRLRERLLRPAHLEPGESVLDVGCGTGSLAITFFAVAIFSASDRGTGMPKSLWDSRARWELLHRLERLSPDAKPRWGRMNAPQMLGHLVNWMGMASGQLDTAAIRLPLRFPVVKQLVIYWMPWPKGVPTAPELIGRDTSDWASALAAVRDLIQSSEKLDKKGSCPAHPAFGKMTWRAWGVLAYRHTDHHFRQFGI